MMVQSRAPKWLTAKPYAHRGLHNDERPENSLAAFGAAVKAGFGIELDVNLSGDDQVMVFHDRDLQRLCGRNDEVAGLSAAALQQIPLLQSHDTIPTLAQTLLQIAGKVPVSIELKGFGNPPHNLEMGVCQLLKDYRGPAAVLSFNPYELAWFAREAPEIIRGMNSKHYNGGDPIASLEKFRRQRFIDAAGAAPDFFTYNCRDLPYWAAENIRQMGRPLFGWTVGSAGEYGRIKDCVDNIIFEGFKP
jgi:glycerophosphoryl diester phosphodiesterase